jgi:hypothetical protein
MPPRLVWFFSGHMIDAPDRQVPRFPASREPVAAPRPSTQQPDQLLSPENEQPIAFADHQTNRPKCGGISMFPASIPGARPRQPCIACYRILAAASQVVQRTGYVKLTRSPPLDVGSGRSYFVRPEQVLAKDAFTVMHQCLEQPLLLDEERLFAAHSSGHRPSLTSLEQNRPACEQLHSRCPCKALLSGHLSCLAGHEILF